jgi:hypothetical protein
MPLGATLYAKPLYATPLKRMEVYFPHGHHYFTTQGHSLLVITTSIISRPNVLYIKAELYRAEHVNQHYVLSFALAALNDIYKFLLPAFHCLLSHHRRKCEWL